MTRNRVSAAWIARRQALEVEAPRTVTYPRRLELHQAAGYVCHYCGTATRTYPFGGTLPDDAATIDHVVPRSAGGGNDSDNLVSACFACNRAKGTNLAASS